MAAVRKYYSGRVLNENSLAEVAAGSGRPAEPTKPSTEVSTSTAAPGNTVNEGVVSASKSEGSKGSSVLQALAKANKNEQESVPQASNPGQSARNRLNRFKLASILTSSLLSAGVGADAVQAKVSEAADAIVKATDEFAKLMGEAGKMVWVRRMADIQFCEMFEKAYTNKDQDIQATIRYIFESSRKAMITVDTVPMSGDDFPAPTAMDPVVSIKLSLIKGMARTQSAVETFPGWSPLFGIQGSDVVFRLTRMLLSLSEQYAGEIAGHGGPDDVLMARQSMIANISRLMPDALRSTLAFSLAEIKAGKRDVYLRDGFPFDRIEADLRRVCNDMQKAVDFAESPK